MKKLIFPLILFCANIVVAQNYQNICSPGITFYIGQNQYFKAFRQDSLHITGNSDTIFYSYRTIRDSTIYDNICKDTTNGDALGRKINKNHDGWFWFFNMKNDTIKLNSQAALNESWKYCSLPGNCHIQATVTSIITDIVLGTTDLVKVISFQAKDGTNNNIPSIFNQKNIKLSQHFGLSEIFDIYWTPFDTLKLKLIGKTTPQLGVQPFTWKDVYNYNIGDELHYYDHQTYNGSTIVYSKSINRILEKTVYGNTDSAHYLVEECKKTWNAPPGTITVMHDTVLIRYDFILLSDNPTISLLPDEFYSQENFMPSAARTYSEFNNRLAQIFNEVAYAWDWSNGCYNDPFELWGPISYYVPGLGRTNWFYEYADIGFYGYYSDLVYYKKGNETWGTPVASDCFVLVSNENKPFTIEPFVEISPNPVETDARILVPGLKPDDNLVFSLYNYSGMKVTEGKISSNPFILNRNGLSSGLYILSISGKDGFIKGRMKIIYK